MEIYAITNEHRMWSDTIRFAENCSWKGGQHLAMLMKENRFREWERVFIAYENDNVIGFCTFTEKDELSEKYSFSPFIGNVFVDEEHRGRRISGAMIENVMSYAQKTGFGAVYIMSGEVGLYEKYGFSPIGYFETIFGTTDQLFIRRTQEQRSILPSVR